MFDIGSPDNKRIFFPYVLDSDSPISFLFDRIISNLDYDNLNVTTLSINPEKYRNNNIQAFRAYPSSSLSRRFQWLRASLKAHDLIHTGGFESLHDLTSRLARMRNPNSSQIHTFRVDVNPDSEFDTSKRYNLAKMADVTTAVSEHTALTAQREFGVDPTVIYNGVDTSKFHSDYDTPDLFGTFKKDSDIILFVGEFTERKRPMDVIDVAKSMQDTIFLLIGDGPLRRSLENKASDLKNVIFTGYLDKESLPPIYANATAFLFPSVREGCPNVVLEAMACGTPVVGYRATSMPELINHGQNGLLTDKYNLDGLIAHVTTIKSEEIAEEFGGNAREYVLENHSFVQIASQYEALYHEVLETSGGD